MSDQATPAPGPATLESLAAEDLDFRGFERMRETGEGPAPEPPSAAPAAAPADAGAEQPPAKTTEGTDPSGDTKQEVKPEPGETDEKKKAGGGFQRRIDKLTREKRALEVRIAELESAAPAPAAAAPAPAAGSTALAGEREPKEEDFETYPEYVRAVARWEIAQHDKARQVEADQQRARDAHEAATTAWQKTEQAAREAHADYDDRLAAVDDLELPGYVRQAIFESPLGAELAYTLAGDRAELERIANLPPLKAARELGRLEASLTPTSKPKPSSAPAPKTSSAPKPVSTVGAAASGASDPDDPEAPYRDWEQRRNAELLRRR